MKKAFLVALALTLAIPAVSFCSDKYDFSVAVGGGGFMPMDRFKVKEAYVDKYVVEKATSDSSYFEIGPFANVKFALVPKTKYIPHELVFSFSWANSKGLFKGDDSQGHYEETLEANLFTYKWGLDVFLRRSGLKPYFGLFWGVVRAGLKIDDKEIEDYGGLLALELGARQDIGRFFVGAGIDMSYGFELWFANDDEERDKRYYIWLDHFPASASANFGFTF